MSARKSTYGRQTSDVTEVNDVPNEVVEEVSTPKTFEVLKEGTTPIRIRKGPGRDQEHTGEYLTKPGVVKLDRVHAGWGHIPGKGWICLDYVKPI